MKASVKKFLTCAGTVGALTIMLSITAMADTKEKTKDTDTKEIHTEEYDWSDKAAAAVNTYANIRKDADIRTERVGKLPAGAVVTVEGEKDGWMKVSSGEIEGYIREDLLVHKEEAKELFQSTYGDGEIEIVGAQSLDAPVQAVARTNAPFQASDADLALMAAIIECEAGGECYEGKVGVGAVVMNRMRSPKFPNTLSGVIYQSGQFTPAMTGKLASVLSRGARQACYDAARDVFAGANTIGDRLFFHAGGGRGLTIGNQTFY